MLKILIVPVLACLVSCDENSARSMGKEAGAASYEANKISKAYFESAMEETKSRRLEELRKDDKGFSANFDSRLIRSVPAGPKSPSPVPAEKWDPRKATLPPGMERKAAK